jgi:DNA gyrase subunit A
MFVTAAGKLLRTEASKISEQGRNTQGVSLIRPDEGDRLVGLDRVVPDAEADGEAVPPPST